MQRLDAVLDTCGCGGQAVGNVLRWPVRIYTRARHNLDGERVAYSDGDTRGEVDTCGPEKVRRAGARPAHWRQREDAGGMLMGWEFDRHRGRGSGHV